MDDLIGFVVGASIVIGIIGAILLLAALALAGALLALECAAVGVVLLLDTLFGASLVPVAPWIPWAICGALIGGAAALSSFAERLGWGGARASLPIVAVLVLLAALALTP